MSVRRKPGYDTLVYFWCAVGLAFVGAILQGIDAASRVHASGSMNYLLITPMNIGAWGCYLLSSVFFLVVAHKVIAMLVYLVHHRPSSSQEH
ncbi:hypothetical protein [Glutamicibacter sp. PS]|uniref:hypothetical protein n=1 Tax=Glutamicibacter TaxID=1742989 RepID=UPI0028454CAE|nr:hypothetical protein [Glutamicibacter sp. PS]MDR4534712.1 hypothetical protein [Glutamicibacter sp. PS]